MPGFVFLLLLIAIPMTLLDLSNASLLSLEPLIRSIFNQDFNTYSVVYGIFFIFLCYMIGHVLKVFSKYQYKLFSILFDDIVNICIANLPSHADKKTKTLPFLNKLFNFYCKIMQDIFYFSANSFPPGSESIRVEVLNRLKSKYEVDLPDDWYSTYKFCKIVEDQEGLKSLSYSFLAKYTAYRSLAFVFLLAFIYTIFIFESYPDMITPIGKGLLTFLLSVISVFWLTFHERYKYYYPLCGNETLIALYYFLIKNKE